MPWPGNTTWISAATPKPDAFARLFCFSYAGAGASAFRGWGAAASEQLEVCTVHLPGRETRLREPAIAELPELVTFIAEAIEPWADRPFALLGHSLGALLAFETARALRERNAPHPETLFVSACRAPHLPWPHAPVRYLDDVALLTEVNRRYGSVPDVIIADVELRELLTPALRADMTLVETYIHEQGLPLAFPVVAFGGDTDPMVSHEALTEWAAHTTGSFRHHTVSGDHLFLQTARRALLREIESSFGLETHLASSTPQ